VSIFLFGLLYLEPEVENGVKIITFLTIEKTLKSFWYEEKNFTSAFLPNFHSPDFIKEKCILSIIPYIFWLFN